MSGAIVELGAECLERSRAIDGSYKNSFIILFCFFQLLCGMFFCSALFEKILIVDLNLRWSFVAQVGNRFRFENGFQAHKFQVVP